MAQSTPSWSGKWQRVRGKEVARSESDETYCSFHCRFLKLGRDAPTSTSKDLYSILIVQVAQQVVWTRWIFRTRKDGDSDRRRYSYSQYWQSRPEPFLVLGRCHERKLQKLVLADVGTRRRHLSRIPEFLKKRFGMSLDATMKD